MQSSGPPVKRPKTKGKGRSPVDDKDDVNADDKKYDNEVDHIPVTDAPLSVTSQDSKKKGSSFQQTIS